ncbi:N-acetylglucosamine-6-phosphate deacetylase [Mollicutes bacterium LVI A0039]|nr:N-acetylglucosamine-6-phosphate deacetylase [Mollicutes bacterium LVI A0039]
MKILKEYNFTEFTGDLRNNNGKISFSEGSEIEFDKRGKYIVPGFIDQHIHGAGGIDTMDNKEIEHVSEVLLKEGTTSFLPTTMTYDLEVVKDIIDRLEKLNDTTGANILGVHVEGPFINGVEFIGAQNQSFVRKPNRSDLEWLNETGFVKMVTYAPELDENLEMTKYMKEQNIVASIGHSGASMAEAELALENGAKCFTHLHNACSGHHHRNPGVVSAALANDQVAELIVDGIHIHPDSVRMTYNVKGKDGIILVTDAMCAKGMEDGIYSLGGQTAIKKGNEARLENGSLAGSVLLMNEAVRNMHKFSRCSLEEAVLMASYNPARNLGIENKGLIKAGFDFDITVLDEEFNVVETYVNGTRKWRR